MDNNDQSEKMESEFLPLKCTPVVIVGAGRSGTNMLRDVLTNIESIATWPCDEINYIWRHGNKNTETDEFEAEDATASVKKYIRSQFRKFALSNSLLFGKSEKKILIEKTCANSLRVSFVDAVLPEAKYIYLVRDGRDVVASAMKRWKAPLDIKYLSAKARYVPKSDLFYYASRYFINRIGKLSNPESRLSVWGPKFKDWQNIVKNNDLFSVCAHQWVRCIERSERQFSDIDKNRIYKLRYEDFVKNPENQLTQILLFLNVNVTSEDIQSACKSVSTSSVGNGANNTSVSADNIALMKSTLESLGYEV